MAKSGDFPDMVLPAITCFFVSCFFLFCYFQQKRGLPWNWPILGMVPSVILHFHHLQDYVTPMLEESETCTDMFRGPWFANKDMLFTCNPSNVHYTSSTKFSNFPRGSETKKAFEFFGKGLFNAEGEEWSKHRKVLRTFFNHQNFNKISTSMVLEKVAEGLVPVLDETCKQLISVIDLQDLMQRFTYDLTINMIAGCDPKSLSVELPEVPFSEAMNDALDGVILRHLIPEYLWKVQILLGIGKEGALRKAKQILDRIASELISSKRQELKLESPNKTFDLLSSYILEFDDFKTAANDQILGDSILSLLLAGKDTTSATLTWFLHTMLKSSSSSVLTKLRQEMKIAISSSGGKEKGVHIFTLEELSKLTYLQAALCETLRLYPAVPFQVRVPIEQDILPTGHVVSPNTTIVIPVYAMGRMTKIWGKDCLDFNPERWINDKGEIKHEPAHKFFTFNAGPRICLGKEIAFIQMKAVAATILYNYNVEIVDHQQDDEVKPVVSIILRMNNGLKATISKRWA